MTHLKFYRTEREKFEAQNNLRILDKNVKTFSNKIARHFKVKLDTVKLRGYSGSAVAYTGERRIGLSHNPRVLIIIHEIGHLYTHQKLGETKHNKNLMRFINKACKYAEKMEYWHLEASPTEKFERKRPKQLIAYTVCPNCGFINDWGMPNQNRIWYKNRYAVGTIHDMSCYQCRVRTNHTIVEQKLISFEDRLQEQLERRRNFSNYALMVIPKIERSLAIPETKALMIYKTPLGYA